MDYTEARKRAFWILSLYAQHSEALLQKLVQKGCSKETAELVIADCQRLGFLNDKEVILRELKRGWGPRAIEYKLRLKRGEVQKVITREMQKKRILELKDKLGEREKAYRTLLRKGFDSELVIEIFSRYEID
jgi:SOS response regulatory protein OraA/RecX